MCFDSGDNIQKAVAEGFYELKVTVELAKCFVDKERRRSGIGSRLVEEAEKFCKDSGYKIKSSIFTPQIFDRRH